MIVAPNDFEPDQNPYEVSMSASTAIESAGSVLSQTRRSRVQEILIWMFLLRPVLANAIFWSAMFVSTRALNTDVPFATALLLVPLVGLLDGLTLGWQFYRNPNHKQTFRSYQRSSSPLGFSSCRSVAVFVPYGSFF